MARGLLFLPDSKTGRKTIVLECAGACSAGGASRGRATTSSRATIQRSRGPTSNGLGRSSRAARGWTVSGCHDLRHSFASVGAGGGLGLPIIGKLLGHTQASTTQRYAHLDADPLRRATDAIAKTIAAAMGESLPTTPAAAEGQAA